MSGPVVILARAGTMYAVRVVPPPAIDRDRALPSYKTGREYADELLDIVPDAILDDRCGEDR